jgi:DEAD/DEAH box helicase
MAAAEADAEPRLFAVPKKRRRKPAVTAQQGGDDTAAVRTVSTAEQHAAPMPAGLTSSPSDRGEHANGARQLQPPIEAEARLSKSKQPQLHALADVSNAADSQPPDGEDAAPAAAESAEVAADSDEVQPMPVTASSKSFRALGVSEWLDRVCRSLGMAQPTQVQAGCIPAILAGRNAIGTAHTGSGKTAAFALPILQLLAADPFGVFALVLTPTRYMLQASSLHTGLIACVTSVWYHICFRMTVMTETAGSWHSSWRSSFVRWAPAWRSKTWLSWAVWTCTSRRAS